MSPWDVLGWMLVGAFAVVLVLATLVTFAAVGRAKDAREELDR